MSEPWHEDDALWRDLTPVLFKQRAWTRAETEVGLLVTLLRLGGSERVLDMPCGPGRHTLELARRGFRVTGVDRTGGYLDEARRRAEAGGLDVELVRADMRGFRRDGAFDVAINMYTSFGYFDDPEDDRRVAEGFFASLAPGGRLVMEMHGKENLAAGFAARDWTELDDGLLLLEERTLLEGWRYLRMRWILIGDATRRERVFTLRLYSAVELIDLLASVGFVELAAFGNLEADPYDEHATRLVVVGRKPG